jgi:hypothetical protein
MSHEHRGAIRGSGTEGAETAAPVDVGGGLPVRLEHKLKFGLGIVALSVPVFAFYLGLGFFLLRWVTIAAWRFPDSADQPR